MASGDAAAGPKAGRCYVVALFIGEYMLHSDCAAPMCELFLRNLVWSGPNQHFFDHQHPPSL